MRRLSRPWSLTEIRERPFGPADCLLSEAEGELSLRGTEHSVLLDETVREVRHRLLLHPYPRRAHAAGPDRQGFPVRPAAGRTLTEPADLSAEQALRRMNEVLARIQELEEALDAPEDLWSRLREAWKRAENEADPRMAEIVRQAQEIKPHLLDLEHRIRRVLRRSRERTPLSRVQELDRASMLWLARQPGNTVAERAGPEQRIMAIVRHENFDTLENRVLHAYCRLASEVARSWIGAHPRASGSARYQRVSEFRAVCGRVAMALADHEVDVAEAGITPNYVLMQDKSYASVLEGWNLLLRRKDAEDRLWAWQAETWTDFVVLAIVLSIDALPDASLVAQSPILWRNEAVQGRWFDQDRPIAVFWLKTSDQVVEVMARPEKPGTLLTLARAHVALRINDLSTGNFPRRVAVWTPHSMERIALQQSVDEAVVRITQLQQVSTQETLRHGLIVTPGYNDAENSRTYSAEGRHGNSHVRGLGFDASGASLADGMAMLGDYIRSSFGKSQ